MNELIQPPQFGDEKTAELFEAVIGGKLPKQGRGRPKKDSTAVRWSDLGLTRQQVWEWIRLAEIPKEALLAFYAKRRAEGRPPSRRGLLVQFGLRKNVASDDVFADDPIGEELVNSLLGPFERILPKLTPRQCRKVIRAMNFRMRALCLRQEMTSEE